MCPPRARKMSGDALTTQASIMSKLALEIVEIDHEGIGRAAGQRQEKVGAIESGNLGRNLLGDYPPVIPIDGRRETHFSAKPFGFVSHDGQHFVGHVDGYGCHGVAPAQLVDEAPILARPNIPSPRQAVLLLGCG